MRIESATLSPVDSEPKHYQQAIPAPNSVQYSLEMEMISNPQRFTELESAM